MARKPEEKPNLKIVRIVKRRKWICEGESGMVVVYGTPDKPLTYERINWLLDLAKASNFNG